MRLYLSSFRMGACPERLIELTRGGTSAVVIANAADTYPPDGRAEGVERELHALAESGFEAAELDLRNYFDRNSTDLVEELRGHDLVWVRGGDVWTLRHALAVSGADHVLAELLADDEIVYGGYSAGPCVLGPTLRGLEMVDDPAWVKALYDAEPIWDGLGVLDFCIVPHVNSPDHPESEACDRLARRYREENRPHRCLTDGEVLIIDGDDTQTCTAENIAGGSA